MDHKTQALETEFGQKIDVQRETTANEGSGRAAGLLKQAADILNPVPGTLEYLGSAAIHIYKSPLLEQVFFVSQYPLGNVTEELASKAIVDLRGSLMEAYGRKRATKRSGF